jgi:hypothetical protein
MLAFKNKQTHEIVIVPKADFYLEDTWEQLLDPPGINYKLQNNIWVKLPKVMPTYKLWLLFTIQEHASIVLAGRSDDGLISVALDRINSGNQISTDDSNLVALIWRAVSLNILSEERADQILSGL